MAIIYTLLAVAVLTTPAKRLFFYDILMNTMNYSLNLKISFLFFVFFFSSCSSHTINEDKAQSSLQRASKLVEQYGQVISTDETNYINALGLRLESPLVKIGKSVAPFKIILLDTQKSIATSLGSYVVTVSSGLIKHLSTESELAFVIAHEMSHEILGHTEHMSLDNETEQPELELEADSFAIVILTAAGYDPRYAEQGLRNVYKYSQSIPLSEYGYPTLEERIDNIRSKINEIEWTPPGTINRRAFNLFKLGLMR
jgi:predicted Zn-dependent protease